MNAKEANEIAKKSNENSTVEERNGKIESDENFIHIFEIIKNVAKTGQEEVFIPISNCYVKRQAYGVYDFCTILSSKYGYNAKVVTRYSDIIEGIQIKWVTPWETIV